MSSFGAPMPPTLPAASRGVLGMPLVAKSNLSTGNVTHASYLIRSDDLSFVFSAPYSTSIIAVDHLEPNSTTFVPTFDHEYCLAFVASYGLAVWAIAVEVKNAETAFHTSVTHGPKPSASPVLLDNKVILTDVLHYGDIVLRYISYNKPYRVSDPNLNNLSLNQWRSSLLIHCWIMRLGDSTMR